MSNERPTYEQLIEQAAQRTLKHGSALPVWRLEAERARRSEEEKSATLRAIGERLLSAGGTRDGTLLDSLNFVLSGNDAKIKALADALEAERVLTGPGECQCREGYLCVMCRSDAALRLVGRLP